MRAAPPCPAAPGLILALILGLLPAAAAAGHGGFRHAERAPDAPPLRPIEYYCTDAAGDRRELGTVICITAGCRTWLARCEMALNVPHWRELQEGCPGAALSRPAAPASPRPGGG